MKFKKKIIEIEREKDVERSSEREKYHHHHDSRRILGCISSVGCFIFSQDSLMHERSLEV